MPVHSPPIGKATNSSILFVLPNLILKSPFRLGQNDGNKQRRRDEYNAVSCCIVISYHRVEVSNALHKERQQSRQFQVACLVCGGTNSSKIFIINNIKREGELTQKNIVSYTVDVSGFCVWI